MVFIGKIQPRKLQDLFLYLTYYPIYFLNSIRLQPDGRRFGEVPFR